MNGVDDNNNGKIDELDEGTVIGLNVQANAGPIPAGKLQNFSGPSNLGVDNTINFNQAYYLNNVPAARKRILIGTSFLYESFDMGDTLTPLFNGANIGGVDIAYGGFFNNVGNPDVTYVASGINTMSLATTAGGAFSVINSPATLVVDIALDPTDWHVAYAVDALGHVWQTKDAGATAWVDVTG